MGDQGHKLDTEPPCATRLIRLPEVMSRVGLGRSTIYRWMAEQKFPRPVRLGSHSVAWAENEIEKWIFERLD